MCMLWGEGGSGAGGSTSVVYTHCKKCAVLDNELQTLLVDKETLKTRKAWRYQRGNQIPHIKEEQTTQLPKETVQKDKQRSTKHTHKTKDRVTRTPLKTGGNLRWSERVSRSCSTSGTRHVNLVTKSWMGKRVITNRQTQQRGATLGTKHRATTKKKSSTQKTTEMNKHGQYQNTGGEPMCSRRDSSFCMLCM